MKECPRFCCVLFSAGALALCATQGVLHAAGCTGGGSMSSTASIVIGILSLGDVTVGGDRPVVVHVPPGYDPAVPMPLLFLLHGYGNSGQVVEDYMPCSPGLSGGRVRLPA